MKINLAWFQLTHEKIRFLVALAGITFADVLMFMQMGFRDALLDSSVRLHRSLDVDIVLLNSQSETFANFKSFSQRRLYQVLGVKGVKSVTPAYLGFAFWKNPAQRNERRILVMGINPEHNLIDLPGVAENQNKTKVQDVVLFDSKSRPEFGPITEWFDQGKQITTEVAARRVSIGGLFSLGTSFGADGNLLTSDVNFFRLFPDRDRGLIDIGLVNIKGAEDVNLVKKRIENRLYYDDVIVLTKEEFINHEKHYWLSRTAIGFVFTLGTIMGFIVGTVIVYQILYTDVADHLPEYATLKAMGYADSYLLTVVFQEAIILACIGFLPGLSISLFMYANAARATGLPILMTAARAGTVLILTILMCCLSGSVAVGKLRSADPADIF